MNSAVAAVAEAAQHLVPHDRVEADHRAQTLSWLASTEDVFRRVKPATPEPHLVSYFILLDRVHPGVLLVEHRLAGLWLPPGGHLEPGEHPVQAVRREAGEELGIEAELLDPDEQPFFLTWTQTAGADPHTDVSLWFLLCGSRDQPLDWDRREFASLRWWSPAEIRQAPADRFDPNLGRFLGKLETDPGWPR